MLGMNPQLIPLLSRACGSVLPCNGYCNAQLKVCAVYKPGTAIIQVPQSASLPAPFVGRNPSIIMLRASGSAVPW